MTRKVYVSKHWAGSTIAMFMDYGFEIVGNPEEADIVAFNGGEDINPNLYGESPAGTYGINQARDDYEVAEYRRLRDDQFKFGICRGGQLLNVLNGGKLWQDVDNHGRTHPLVDLRTGRVLKTTSVHHQSFRPGPNCEIVAVASEATRKRAEDLFENFRPVSDLAKGEDLEVLWYPKTRSLCIQGHPEYMLKEFTDYCINELIERYYG